MTALMPSASLYYFLKAVACKYGHSSIKAAGTYKGITACTSDEQNTDQIDCEMCAHPFSRIVFGGFNLFSRPHIVPAPAIAFSAPGFTHSAQQASSPSSGENSQFL